MLNHSWSQRKCNNYWGFFIFTIPDSLWISINFVWIFFIKKETHSAFFSFVQRCFCAVLFQIELFWNPLLFHAVWFTWVDAFPPKTSKRPNDWVKSIGLIELKSQDYHSLKAASSRHQWGCSVALFFSLIVCSICRVLKLTWTLVMSGTGCVGPKM